MTATLNGGISGGSSEKAPVQPAPKHSPITEKPDEYEHYELDKLDENKNGDGKRVVPPQEGVPLLEKRNHVDSSAEREKNGNPQYGNNGVQFMEDGKPNETQCLEEEDAVCWTVSHRR